MPHREIQEIPHGREGRGGKEHEGKKEGREEKKIPQNKFLKSKGNSHHK